VKTQLDDTGAELKKEAYEFKRDIVVGAENMRTGKTVAEKIYRYMEDKLRHKDQVGCNFCPFECLFCCL
jgi:hypothetical protein